MSENRDSSFYEELSEINTKLDQIHHNQEQLFEMLGQIGAILSRYARLEKVVRQDDMKSERHKEIIARYGETCTQIDAGKILNVSPRTIARWIEEGRITAIGRQVDVRSICAYLDADIPKGTRIKRKALIADPSADTVPDNPPMITSAAITGEEIESMGEFERAARGIKKKRQKS